MSQRYQISFEFQRGVLRARVTGSSSMASTIAYWNRIADKFDQLQPTSLLLIDEMSGTPLTADDWMVLVEAMSGKGFETVRIAHVKPRGLEQVEFCEIFAKEAGIDARVFADANVAELWLRHGEGREPDAEVGGSGARQPELGDAGNLRD